jgi:hypothetical protein
MRTTIRDPEVFSHLQPLEVAAYLRTRHWRKSDDLGQRGSVWTLATGGDLEVLLPLSTRLKDFVQRMSDVVKVLEVAENRPQVDIVSDIARTTSDAVRITAEGPAMPDGTVPVEQGTQMLIHAKELLLSAACAAVDKRTVYPTRKPTRAVEYLRHVKLAAPERGSFVLTLLSPVPPSLAVQPSLLPDEPPPVPFERSVTIMLARALAATARAATEASETGTADAFMQSVNDGVHANLCESIEGLFSQTEATRLQVGIAWAPTRPVETAVPSSVSFSADIAPILQTAAQMFRERAPIPDFRLQGLVIELRREEGEVTGTITVLALVEDSARKVRVELAGSDYDLAIEAHRDNVGFRCIGELTRDGRSFVLRHPREVSLITD